LSEKPFAVSSITLEGVWSMEQAAHLRTLLAERLARILELKPGSDRVEIDLAEVSDLDACGCQLLVVFLENLKRRGITPVPYGLKQQIVDKIDLLGFSGAFAAPDQA